MYSDPVQKEYSHLAPRYDRRWSFYVDATIQETLARLNLNPQERILDLGCGTGTLIQYLLHLVPDVEIVGLDPSVEMLNVARQKLPDSVELRVGSADSLPFPSDWFWGMMTATATKEVAEARSTYCSRRDRDIDNHLH